MKCSECTAECCRFTPFEDDKLKKIAGAINLSLEEFKKIYRARILQDDEYCIHVDEAYKCRIYKNRPEVCKEFFCSDWEPEEA